MLTNNTNSPKYLSLRNAAESYGYTRDHLGLMIRKGKLQGMKLGNYYVTTNDWMVRYIKNFADINHPISRNKLSNKFLTGILTDEKKMSNVSIKSIKSGNKNQSLKLALKTDPKNSFKEKMSEELSNLSSFSRQAIDSSQESANFKDHGFKMNLEHPYIVLPIRKMNSDERDNILNKISSKKSA